MAPPTTSASLPASAEEISPTSQADWFKAEVAPHERSLRMFLRSRFPGLSEVDDLVQETYLRVFRARQRGQKLNKSYILTVGRNAGLDLFRRSRIVQMENVEDMAQLPAMTEDLDAAASAQAAQERQLLLDAIAALPERCRQVVTLRRIYDLSHQEIATKLGISCFTVNAQLTAGMAKLRDYLREHGVSRGSQP